MDVGLTNWSWVVGGQTEEVDDVKMSSWRQELSDSRALKCGSSSRIACISLSSLWVTACGDWIGLVALVAGGVALTVCGLTDGWKAVATAISMLL